jgi:hypothetical protein
VATALDFGLPVAALLDLAHRAAATLTPENMLQPATSGSTSTRLQRATFAVAHAFDHDGKRVEHLRLNGVVPPATRARSR